MLAAVGKDSIVECWIVPFLTPFEVLVDGARDLEDLIIDLNKIHINILILFTPLLNIANIIITFRILKVQTMYYVLCK